MEQRFKIASLSKNHSIQSIKTIVSIVLIMLLFQAPVNACEVSISVEGTTKEKYKAGEVVVLKITVVLKHRNCDVDIKETAITVSGCQITAATDWVNTSGKTWERKIRIKIADHKTGKIVVTAERTCDRDGGKGTITLHSGI